MARLRGTRLRRVGPDDRLSVVEHLDELRRRVIVSLVALVVAFGVAYGFQDQLLEILQWPLPDRYKEGGLITLSPTEPFFTVLKVCFWTAILVALPVWLYQAYAFIIPAVADQSRRVTIAVVTALSGLFMAGVAFGYFVVLPVALNFLVGFGGDNFNSQLRAGDYFSFATSLLLASGLMFEVPIAMAALARMGVASAAIYRRQWRVALIAIAVLAAILPGGDPFSMLLLMIPQIVLYAVGIALSARFGQVPLWRRGEPADAP